MPTTRPPSSKSKMTPGLTSSDSTIAVSSSRMYSASAASSVRTLIGSISSSMLGDQRIPTAEDQATRDSTLPSGAVDRLVDPGEQVVGKWTSFGSGDAFGEFDAVLDTEHQGVDWKRQRIAMRQEGGCHAELR